MQPQKTVQPSEEVEEEAKNNLINVVHDPENEEPQDVNVSSPDELDQADRTAEQKANEMLAKAELKELPDRNNLDDTPYVHNSTEGFGAPGLGGYPFSRLFPNSKSQRALIVFLIILTIIGLIIKYAHYL